MTSGPEADIGFGSADRWGLGLILLVALAVRAIGLRAGLSGAAVGDEPSVVQHAMAFGSGDFNPHYFVYPAFHMYVLFGVFVGYYVVGWLAGFFGSPEAFATAFVVDASSFYLLARAISVVAGVVTVWALARVAGQVFGRRVGLLAALLLAVSPFHVWDSHFAIADASMVLVLVLGVWAIDRVAQNGTPRDYVTAGALIGLGAATKYIPVLLAAVLVLAHVAGPARSPGAGALGDSRLWLGLGAAVIVFFLASPFTVLDASTALAQVQERIVESTSSASQNRIVWTKLVRDHGVAFLVAVIGGAWIVVRRGGLSARLLLVFPALFLGLAVIRGYWATRYFSPLLPFFCALAALAIVRGVGRLPARAHALGLLAGVAVVLAVPVATVARDLQILRAPTTRESATAWIEATIPAGATLVTDPYFRLAPTKDTIRTKLHMLEGRSTAKGRLVAAALRRQLDAVYPRPRYRLLFSTRYPDSSSYGVADRRDYYSVSDYLARGAEYFVVGMPRYGEVEAETYQAFFGDLAKCCRVLHEVPAGPDPRLSPPVRIYQVVR